MQSYQLSVKTLLNRGWKNFTNRAWFYAGAHALFALIVIILSGLSQNGSSFLVSVIASIASIWISAGFIRFYLNATSDTTQATIRDVFMEYKPLVWLRYFVGSLIVGIIVLIGFVFLIIPGIYLAIRLSLFRFVLIDKRETIAGAIKTSWQLTRGLTGKICVLSIVILVINLIGFLLIGIGALITIPFTGFAFMYLYKDLIAQSSATPQQAVTAEPVA